MSRGLRITLIVSLALNLFFIGAVVTSALYHRFNPSPRAQFIDFPFNRGLGRWLESETRDRLRETTREERHALGEAARAVRAARRNFGETLMSQPYNAGMVRAALAESSQAEKNVVDASENLTAKTVSLLSPQERKALADRVVKSSEMRSRNRRDGADSRPPDRMPPDRP